jgi:membrane protein DedA with SNARE-associated domain
MMSDALAFLMQHRYAVLFSVVLLEQLGLPIPATPFLLGAGALAGMGQLSFGAALGLAVSASFASDLVWYQAGRRRGGSILRLLCRISLEPDSCVRRTENTFARYGARTLLVSKFVPGLNTVATPLAGIVGMRLPVFVLYSIAGGTLWAGTFLLLGHAFRHQLDAVARLAIALGGRLAAVLAVLFAAWLAWKWHERRRFLRALRVARIGPEELKLKLDAGEDVVIVDLRHALDFEADPRTIPGALRFAAEDLEETHAAIPRGREVVLYCT